MKYPSFFIAECNAAGCHAYESFLDWLEKCAGIARTVITTSSFPNHWNTKYCVLVEYLPA